MFQLPYNCAHFASKVVLKILQSRFQHYVNWEIPDVQAGFRKDRGIRDKIANICCITEKAREFQKNSYFCLFHYAEAFDCVDHSKLWKILKEMEIPHHLTWILRNLYAGQQATVRTRHRYRTRLPTPQIQPLPQPLGLGGPVLASLVDRSLTLDFACQVKCRKFVSLGTNRLKDRA